jgi:hypothetical protein
VNHRSLAAAAAALALLVPIGAACSGDDDGPALRTSADGPAATTATTGPGGDVSDTGATGSDAGGSDGGSDAGGSDGGSDSGGSQGDVPEDAALDISQRTPGGVTLNVTGLHFDGDDILVDAEFKNGQADYEVYLYQGYPTYDLHLLDAAGQAYNFIEPEGEGSPMSEGQIVLQPGESLSGTFAFRGPLAGRPDQISLVSNLYDENVATYELEDQTEGTYPAFVVPMDLTWA